MSSAKQEAEKRRRGKVGKPAPTTARQVHEEFQHGGARPGAGRPRKDPSARTKPVGFSLHPDLIAWIETASAEKGISKSALVAQVLERARKRSSR